MNALIIEDEQPTALRLQKMIVELDPGIRIVKILDTIEASIAWLHSNPHPDLIFQDIHLADGSCFEIYRSVKIEVPVVFTTAFDQYAIDAFKVNGIDYLLKPVTREQLKGSLDKLKRFSGTPKVMDYQALAGILSPKSYQNRFMVRYGQKIKVIATDNIAYFYTLQGNNFFKTIDGKEYPSDFSLDKLEGMLDPAIFFRINRQIMISIKAIKDMYSYSKSRVKVELDPPCDFETIASTERSGDFKKWLAGETDGLI
jgi:two-component system LytT family response regulator